MSVTRVTSGAKAVLTWVDWGEPETTVIELAAPAVMVSTWVAEVSEPEAAVMVGEPAFSSP